MTLFGPATALDAVPHTTHTVDTQTTSTRRMATPIARRVDTGMDTLRTPELARPPRRGEVTR